MLFDRQNKQKKLSEAHFKAKKIVLKERFAWLTTMFFCGKKFSKKSVFHKTVFSIA